MFTTDTGQMAVVLRPGTEFGRFAAHLVNSWPDRVVVTARHTVWTHHWTASPQYRRGVFDALVNELCGKAARERLSILSLGPVFACPNAGAMTDTNTRHPVRSNSAKLPVGSESFTFERRALAIPLHLVD